jgi:hypothetical protein
MIPRRNLVTGGPVGGVLGALGAADDVDAAPAVAAGGEVTEDMVAKIVAAIGGLRSEIQAFKTFPEIAPIRDAQLTHLRANGKFPDYMEVGTTSWFTVHDWHIRWQQPLNIGRDSLGRYTLLFGQTLSHHEDRCGGKLHGCAVRQSVANEGSASSNCSIASERARGVRRSGRRRSDRSHSAFQRCS